MSLTGSCASRWLSLIQFTVPGAPTVFYGDEVGVTGDDDPDDRRTYPWADKGGARSLRLFALPGACQPAQANPALLDGDFRILLANDDDGIVAYGRKTATKPRLSSSTAAIEAAACHLRWPAISPTVSP